MMNDYKQFALLSKPEKLALFEAWLDGKQMQWRNLGGRWIDLSHPLWDPASYYRIKPPAS